MTYATAQGRAIYTFNRGHFCRLHSEILSGGRGHAGIIVSHQQRYHVGEQLRRLLRLVGCVSAEEMQNRLEFLSDWGSDE